MNSLNLLINQQKHKELESLPNKKSDELTDISEEKNPQLLISLLEFENQPRDTTESFSNKEEKSILISKY